MSMAFMMGEYGVTHGFPGRVARGHVDFQSVVTVWRVCHRSRAALPLWHVLETLHSSPCWVVVRAMNEDGIECLVSLLEVHEDDWIIHEVTGGLMVVYRAETYS